LFTPKGSNREDVVNVDACLPGTSVQQEMMEGAVVGTLRCSKLQSDHHQNTQAISGWMAFLSPSQQCQSTEGKQPDRNNTDIRLVQEKKTYKSVAVSFKNSVHNCTCTCNNSIPPV